MKYKKIMLLAIFLVSLLAVSAVSAAENATEDIITDVASEDVVSVEDNNQVMEQTDNDDNLSVENDLDILSTDYSTYSELSSEIGDGGNITLQHDYYAYDDGNTIKITVDGSVIDGNGAIIDMDDQVLGHLL